MLSFLHIPLKCFVVSHLSLLVLIPLLCILKQLEISSRTKILFQAVLTGYQIDNVIAITMKDPHHIISSVGNNTCEIIRAYQIIFENVAFDTTCDRISSINFVVRV